MAVIGLVIRPGIKKAVALGEEVITWAHSKGHTVLVEQRTSTLLNSRLPGVDAATLARDADPIVTLGGDGTLIGIARHVTERTPIIIGVNFGNLGFLTEISPREAIPTLESVFSDQAVYGVRSMIQADVYRGNDCIFSSQAVNDAVVQKGSRDRLLDIDFAVDEEDVMRMRGDGLIVATPTGSTAYSLAAGGSIVFPTLSVVLITPICPHSLTSRPLILRLDSILRISIPPYEGRVYLSIDGQESTALHSGDVVRLTKAKESVKFVRSPAKSYFDILRTKLNWGIGNSGD